MKRVLGIEGGGTKTEWFYDDQSTGVDTPPLRGILPAANLRLISDASLEAILRVLPSEAEAVGLFLAGCADREDRERLANVGRSVWPRAALTVGSDRESGFAAAFGADDGVAVIAGTGSAITGRRGDRLEKAGGWGHLLGDKGSGYDLGMQALRHVLWHYDLTHQMTAPAEEILAALGLSRLDELVAWAAHAGKMDVAKLASVVFRGAQGGDAAMKEIIATGAGALADGAAAVAQRLGLKAARVVLQGGLFAHHPEYRMAFQQRMAGHDPAAVVELCETSGAIGASWLASRGHSTVEEALSAPSLENDPRALPGSLAAPSPLALPDIDLTSLAHAPTEAGNPRSERLSDMKTLEIVDLFVSEEEYVTDALSAARFALQEAIDLTAAALQQGGRLFYIGAGTSGRLGVLDASEIPPTFGTEPSLVQGIIAGGVEALYRAVEGAEDQAEMGILDLRGRGFGERDVLCGIAASGRTPYVLGALAEARRLGGRTLLLTCNPSRPREHPGWDVELDLATGPELLTGSTRLKAGTATKCALNLLSTAVMVRLGRVEGNSMVHVQATNQKLKDRAIRLVSRVLNLSREEAMHHLIAHQWNVAQALEQKI